jgi:hypothetical protein
MPRLEMLVFYNFNLSEMEKTKYILLCMKVNKIGKIEFFMLYKLFLLS